MIGTNPFVPDNSLACPPSPSHRAASFWRPIRPPVSCSACRPLLSPPRSKTLCPQQPHRLLRASHIPLLHPPHVSSLQLFPDGRAVPRWVSYDAKVFAKFADIYVHGGPPIMPVPGHLSGSSQPYCVGIMHHIDRYEGGKGIGMVRRNCRPVISRINQSIHM